MFILNLALFAIGEHELFTVWVLQNSICYPYCRNARSCISCFSFQLSSAAPWSSPTFRSFETTPGPSVTLRGKLGRKGVLPVAQTWETRLSSHAYAPCGIAIPRLAAYGTDSVSPAAYAAGFKEISAPRLSIIHSDSGD